MVGKTLTKVDILDGLSSLNGVVDYTLGTLEEYGASVFVIAEYGGKQEELSYLKMGEGPRYLFFKDYHLCFFESLISILEVKFLREKIVQQHQNTSVYTFAKKDLIKDTILDGIGGYDSYGLIDVDNKNLLPIGLSEYCKLNKNINTDESITLEDVEMEDNELTRFWNACNDTSC